MQLAWLEELTKMGHVSTAERDGIYDSCSDLLKVAASGEQIMSGVEKVMAPLAPFVILPLISSWLGKREHNRQETKAIGEHEKDLAKTRAALLAHPDFANHQAKVEARFLEIAKLAPTVARNENLMMRILKEKLHSGLTHEDVTNLAMIQASYTPNYSFQSKLEKKAAATTAGEILADVLILCKEAGIAKEADITSMFKTVGKTLQHAATLAAPAVLLSVGAGAINAGLDWRSRQNREKALIQSYQAVLDPNHPDTELLRSEPERAREAFKTLVHFAPSVALEPSSARSFMNKIVAYQAGSHRGGVQSTDLKELAEIEKNMRAGGGGSAFFKGFTASLPVAGFPDAIKGGFKPLTDPLSHQLSTEVSKGMGLEPTKSNYQPHGTNAFEAAERARAKRDPHS